PASSPISHELAAKLPPARTNARLVAFPMSSSSPMCGLSGEPPATSERSLRPRARSESVPSASNPHRKPATLQPARLDPDGVADPDGRELAGVARLGRSARRRSVLLGLHGWNT